MIAPSSRRQTPWQSQEHYLHQEGSPRCNRSCQNHLARNPCTSLGYTPSRWLDPCRLPPAKCHLSCSQASSCRWVQWALPSSSSSFGYSVQYSQSWIQLEILIRITKKNTLVVEIQELAQALEDHLVVIVCILDLVAVTAEGEDFSSAASYSCLRGPDTWSRTRWDSRGLCWPPTRWEFLRYWQHSLLLRYGVPTSSQRGESRVVWAQLEPWYLEPLGLNFPAISVISLLNYPWKWGRVILHDFAIVHPNLCHFHWPCLLDQAIKTKATSKIQLLKQYQIVMVSSLCISLCDFDPPPQTMPTIQEAKMRMDAIPATNSMVLKVSNKPPMMNHRPGRIIQVSRRSISSQRNVATAKISDIWTKNNVIKFKNAK